MNIAIINGPNLNLLGKREPEIYGTQSFDEYLEILKQTYPDIKFTYYQSNHEGDIIDKLQEYGFNYCDGILLNAGGYTHTSIAISDCIRGIKTPVIEIHLSDTNKREDYRKISFIREACVATFAGFGMKSYDKGIDKIISICGKNNG